MRSNKIIYILFIFCLTNVFALTNLTDKKKAKFSIDSLTELSEQKNIGFDNAEKLLELIEDGMIPVSELNSEDLKKISLSFLKLGNSEKATYFSKLYIKKSYDTGFLRNDAFNTIETTEEYKKLKNSYLPKLNVWVIFFVITGIVGVFVSIVMNIRRKGDVVSNLLMGFFVFFHSLFLLHLALYLTNYNYNYPHSYWGTITFSFLYGPLLYFYFKRTSENYTFKKIDVLHLIPTVIIVLYFIPIYMLSGKEKLHKMFNVDNDLAVTLKVIIAFKAISLIVYGIKALKIYDKNKSNAIKFPAVLLWQRNMSLLNIGYAITYLVYGIILSIVVIFERSNNVMLYSQVIVLSFIVLYVAYTAYVQPDIFQKKYLFDTIVSKYQKSGLTRNYSLELKNQLVDLLNKEKVYKINDLNLNSLAEIIGTSRHNLSQVINEHFNMNFFNLINSCRIEEAKEILLSDNKRNLNIIDVAYEVGFNNKVTFNKAFKEITNLTPSQFIKLNSESSYSVKLR